MAVDKVRIKKYQSSKVQKWCAALQIPESRFVEDSINFYVRFLEDGQTPVIPPFSSASVTTEQIEVDDNESLIDDTENDFENHTGGIDL